MGHRLIALEDSPWVWVETTWAVILCALAFLLRLIIRSHEYGVDDLLLALACVLAITSFGLIYKALDNGLGTSQLPMAEELATHLARLVVGSTCLCFAADGCSKLSTVAILYKIICRGTIRDKKHLAGFVTIGSITVVWILLSIGLWASRCSSPYLRLLNHKSQLVICSKGSSDLEAIVSLSVLIESGIFMLSSWSFCGLNMQTHKKATVITIFGMRLPLILLYIYFCVAFKRYAAGEHHATIMYGSAIYWQIALLGYSILATAIQPFKRAADSLSTHNHVVSGKNASASRSGQNSKLQTLSSRRRSQQLADDASSPPSMWSTVQTAATRRDCDSIESNNSQEFIVKKTDYKVTYSDGRQS